MLREVKKLASGHTAEGTQSQHACSLQTSGPSLSSELEVSAACG